MELLSKSGVNEGLHEAFVECISARTEDIQKALITAASQISQSYLKDFDWKLQVCLSLDLVCDGTVIC